MCRMAAKVQRACVQCGCICSEEKCFLCGGQTSKEWQGYVVILDHANSKIAEKIGIGTNGYFALKVR